MRKLLLITFALAVLATAGLGIFTMSQGGVPKRSQQAIPAASAAPVPTPDKTNYPKPRPRVVVALRPGDTPPPDSVSAGSTGASSGTDTRAASDAEIRAELNDFRKYLREQGPGVAGPVAKVLPNGDAVAPRDAPPVVKRVIAAGNQIARTPYLWGGGHGAWADKGYDCSGSVSFALAGAGLLNSPLDSTRFMSYGSRGDGRWITIYASAGHVFMYVAGLRFDTSGRSGKNGTRWQPALRGTGGFTARHPTGY